MKPEELIPGQRYRLREGLEPSTEADLKGTDRVVELFSSIPSCNEYTFVWRNYTDCIAIVRAEDVECWIPRIGEEALFYNKDSGTSTGAEMWSYAANLGHPFFTSMGAFRHCKPLPKEATPVPNRNQTFELAELEAMQEEAMLEAIENHKSEIIVPDPEQSRYAALKHQLIELEDWRGRVNVQMAELKGRIEVLEDQIEQTSIPQDEIVSIIEDKVRSYVPLIIGEFVRSSCRAAGIKAEGDK